MNEKKVHKFSIDGVIVFFANVCGIIIPNIFEYGEIADYSFSEWWRFQKDYAPIWGLAQLVTFIVPITLCVLYSRSKKKSHIVNLPFAYATLGMSGWFSYLVIEIIALVIAMIKGYDFTIKYILLSSFANVLVKAYLIFSLSFFLLETIHRKYLLPYYFPDGHLSKIEGVRQPSVKFLLVINYLSVTLFPVVFLSMLYLKLIFATSSKIQINYIITFSSILLIGIIITFLLFNYFEKPLKSLKNRIVQIEKGDYESRVQIITNDSFGELADTINDMTASIDAKTQKILEIQNSVVTGMATMVESRDNSTGGHIKRTSDCVKIFINQLKKNPEYEFLSESYCNAVIKAAPMHDLGKIAVDDAILRKPGKFTDEEYEKMKVHPEQGAIIVEKVLRAVEDEEFKKIAINVAHYHHEKWNGEGYPCKIKEEEIPLEARIMALADVFDALVSKRCYKDSFSYDKAFQIIQESLGTHFDPKLGKEFILCRSSLENLYNSY